MRKQCVPGAPPFFTCTGDQANCQSIAHLYKAIFLALLDYCCWMWNPHQSIYTAKLEKVQKFAAKLATGLWSENYNQKEYGTGGIVKLGNLLQLSMKNAS